MIHFYIILILIALASGIVGFYAKRIIMNINAYRTRLKQQRQQQFSAAVRAEVLKYLEELKTK